MLECEDEEIDEMPEYEIKDVIARLLKQWEAVKGIKIHKMLSARFSHEVWILNTKWNIWNEFSMPNKTYSGKL